MSTTQVYYTQYHLLIHTEKFLISHPMFDLVLKPRILGIPAALSKPSANDTVDIVKQEAHCGGFRSAE